jgi:hypothetical protein
MSALEWCPADVGDAGRRARSRPHLVVLPGGRVGASARRGSVRITRRGRLAVLGLSAGVVAVAGSLGVGAAGATQAPHVVTVAVGQTLSEVAAAELSDLSISDGILAIQLANRMSTAQVSAGQQLVIPRS